MMLVVQQACERPTHTAAIADIARPSVVCNARAPYSAGWNFRQYSYTIWYRDHPLTSKENFTENVPVEPLRRGGS